MKLPIPLRNEIIVLLKSIPVLRTIDGRKSFLYSSALDEELLNRIQFDGSTDKFCNILIKEIEEFKPSKEQKDPIEAILEESENHLGLDKRDNCKAIILRWQKIREKGIEGTDRKTPEDFICELGLQIFNAKEDIYLHVSDLFIKPKLYDNDIKDILKENHIIFILGDPHVGKTYTAIFILWELYQEGYKPQWIGQSQLSSLFQGSGLGSIKLNHEFLKDGTATYIEDPFGRSTPIEIQEFINNLHNMIISVKQADVRIIVTSRTNIFNTVVGNRFAKYIVTLSQKMELGNAYEAIDLKKIILKYARFYNVRWLDDNNFNAAVDMISKRLTAPHNIELFIRATRDSKSTNEALTELNNFLDVALEFGNELGRLPLWQKGFLLYIYFFSNSRINKKITENLYLSAAQVGIFGSAPMYPWELSLGALSNYLTHHSDWLSEYFTFRHPSLEEGFDICVDSDPALEEIIKITIMQYIENIDSDIRLASFNCFLHYSSSFGDTEWGRKNIKQIAESKDTYIRELSRNYIILEYDNLSPVLKEEIFSYASEFWNERSMLKLLIGARLKPEQRRILTIRLASTWDDWVRYKIAENISQFSDNNELLKELSEKFLNDKSCMVRRMTARNLLHLTLLRSELDLVSINSILEHAHNDEDYGVKLDVNRILKDAANKYKSRELEELVIRDS